MSAPLSSSARRGVTVAYPFCLCMIKQALLICATALLFAGGIALGHFATTSWPGPGNWFGAGQPVDATVLDKLKSELNLTPAQAAKIAPIISATCENLLLLSEEQRAQRLAIMDDISTTITPQLSPDQQRRLATLESELQHRPPLKRDMRIVALF